jgi:hypothetical protein
MPISSKSLSDRAEKRNPCVELLLGDKDRSFDPMRSDFLGSNTETDEALSSLDHKAGIGESDPRIGFAISKMGIHSIIEVKDCPLHR